MKRLITVYWVFTVIALTFCIHIVATAKETPVHPIENLIQPTQIEEPKEIIPEHTETIISEPQIVNVPVEEIPTEVPVEKAYRYIKDCPLSEEIQQGIFDICESYNMSFEFVMAVIFKESSFRPNVSGDNGKSKGLMQIQEKWHNELMVELGVTDLLDPLENVKVGVALLSSYFEESDDVYYVLMKYNGGYAYAQKMLRDGKVSKYAKEVTERAIKYEEENGI